MKRKKRERNYKDLITWISPPPPPPPPRVPFLCQICCQLPKNDSVIAVGLTEKNHPQHSSWPQLAPHLPQNPICELIPTPPHSSSGQRVIGSRKFCSIYAVYGPFPRAAPSFSKIMPYFPSLFRSDICYLFFFLSEKARPSIPSPPALPPPLALNLSVLFFFFASLLLRFRVLYRPQRRRRLLVDAGKIYGLIAPLDNVAEDGWKAPKKSPPPNRNEFIRSVEFSLISFG